MFKFVITGHRAWKIVTRLFLIYYCSFFNFFFSTLNHLPKGFCLFIVNLFLTISDSLSNVFFFLFFSTSKTKQERTTFFVKLKNYPETLYLFRSKAIVRCLNFNFQVNSIQSFLFTFWIFIIIICFFFLLAFHKVEKNWQSVE